MSHGRALIPDPKLVQACYYAANISAEDLAEALGVSTNTVQQIVTSAGPWWDIGAFTLVGAVAAKLREVGSYREDTAQWLEDYTDV